jgi:hypothetical protein
MLVRTNAVPSVAMLAVGLLSLTMPPAEALTTKECGAKYQAAKTSGTLGGQSWSEFRKNQCGPDAAATPAAAPTATTSGERGLPHGRVAEVHE